MCWGSLHRIGEHRPSLWVKGLGREVRTRFRLPRRRQAVHVQAGVHVPRSRADTPPILRARCSYSQRRYVQVERFCLVKTEVGLCVVAVSSHPRELLSGLMAPPAEEGSTGRGPAPPFPPPLTAARAGMWRGRRESHGPLTPRGQSAALGCSHRPSLLAWRFPVWKKCRWLLSPRPIPPRLRSASAVTCRRSLVTGGWRNPQRLC